MRKSVTIRIGDVSLASDGDDSEAGDILALEAFSTSTNAPAQLTGWATSGMTLSPAPEGVTVAEINGENRVTSIDVSNQGLTGSLPTELGNLKRCVYFNVFYNSLSGTLPPAMFNMPLVHCYLNHGTGNPNSVSDPDPHINATTGGQDVHPGKTSSNTQWNVFTGGIPDEVINLAPTCEWFMCSFTEITDYSNNIFDLVNLVGLYLAYNPFTQRQLSSKIGQLTSMTHFALRSLDHNDPVLVGDMPSEILNLTSIRFFRIADNRLNIDFNELDFSVWTNLDFFYIDRNNWSGPFPTYFFDGTLPDMNVVFCSWPFNWASGSGFTGELPEVEAGMDIRQINISGNQLGGVMPASMWSTLTNLILTNFGFNNFTGIGTDYVASTELRRLRWQNCKVTGRLPNLDWNQSFPSTFSVEFNNNQYTFEDMLWIPDGEVDTVYELYASRGYLTAGALTQDDIGEPQEYELEEGQAAFEVSLEDVFTHADNSYQWQKDGVNISGETAASIIIGEGGVALSDDGEYQLLVTNTNINGLTLRSSNIVITVNEV